MHACVGVRVSVHVCVKETAGNLSNDIAFTHLVYGDAQKDENHGKPVTRKEKKEWSSFRSWLNTVVEMKRSGSLTRIMF